MKTLLNNKMKIIYLFAGALYALSFPFKDSFHLFPAIILAAGIYFSQFFDKEIKMKTVLINTLLFLWGYNLVGYYWLTFTLKVFGGLFPPFNFILWQLFTLIIAPQFYIFVFIYFILKKKAPEFLDVRNRLLPISISTLWVILEYYTPQQFPALFGHPWLALAPKLKLAHIFGSPIYTFLTVYLGINLYLMAIHKVRNKFPWLLISSLLITQFFMGDIEVKSDSTTRLRLVQANIGNDLKLKSENGLQLAASQVVNIFKDMSSREYTKKPDLIVWPETSYPRILATFKRSHVPYELSGLVRKMDTKFFIGTYDLASNRADLFEQQYNTAVLIGNNGKIRQTYHKRVLIPFGEGLPFGPLNKYFAKVIKNISFFAKGKNFTHFQYDDQSFISLICYEVLFPRYVRDYLNSLDARPKYIMNLTNDSWYGRYSEQEQHLFLSKWRALEFNLPLVRMTNTGITSIVMPNGLEKARIGNFKQDILDVDLETAKTEATLYQRFGILNFLIFIALVILAKMFILKILPSEDRAYE
jgi:apolipoprotein N-acyltransferase